MGLDPRFHTARGAHAPSHVPVGAPPTVSAAVPTTGCRKQQVQDCSEAPQSAREARALPRKTCEVCELEGRLSLLGPSRREGSGTAGNGKVSPSSAARRLCSRNILRRDGNRAAALSLAPAGLSAVKKLSVRMSIHTAPKPHHARRHGQISSSHNSLANRRKSPLPSEREVCVRDRLVPACSITTRSRIASSLASAD